MMIGIRTIFVFTCLIEKKQCVGYTRRIISEKEKNCVYNFVEYKKL